MSDYIGKRYQITKHIGKGGMADVYLAFDTILKREVAVKILKSDMSDDDVALERFKREAGAITQLSHPNIVDVYDVGDDLDNHYIVMEYVKGYTLKQLIKKRGAIPYKETVWIMKQLAGALLEAHRNNIIHRDVKSQNVLVKDDGTIKLSDFGIALANGAGQITSKDSILGSVHYLAPEISRGKHATMQSDIYSLGIVMYELLVGDVPYKADTAVQVALKHIKENVPSVRKINPNIPQSVENIIIKATAKSLNNRYSNIALMLNDLNNCLKPEHAHDQKIRLNNIEEDKQNKYIKLNENNEIEKPKKSIGSIIFLLSASLLSVIALFAVLFFTGIIGSNVKYAEMPDIINKTVLEAKDLLDKYDLKIDDTRIKYEYTDNIEADLIISCDKEVGSKVEKGGKVKIVVSKGTFSIMKNYIGEDYLSAKEELISLNFNVICLPVDSNQEPGTVVEQSMLEGEKYEGDKQYEITLKYSRETSLIVPPEIYGRDIVEAQEILNSNSLRYTLVGKDKSFFTEDELLYAKNNMVLKADPDIGSSFVPDDLDDYEIKVYYYVEQGE